VKLLVRFKFNVISKYK